MGSLSLGPCATADILDGRVRHPVEPVEFGVGDVLADPQLVVTPLGQTAPLAGNDNWGGTPVLASAFAATGAFPLEATSKDAALLIRLPPGAYTVTVSGSGNTTGTALVEIYDVP